jgi:putative ABC transport system permease protein
MVVFQFASSIIIITATIVVFNQLNFIQNKKLGFNKENVLIVHDTYILGDKTQSFKNEVVNDSRIISGSVSNSLPVESSRSSNGTFRDGRSDDEKLTPMQSWRVDYDYIPTLGLELVEGRNFSKDYGSDTIAVIINEAAAKHFEWEEPIGKRLSQYTSSDGNKITTYNVVGVVKNFHYESLKNNIGPLILFLSSNSGRIVFRFSTENTNEVVDLVRDKWEEFVPGQAFAYTFMDDDFNKMYKSEQRIGKLFSVFAFLAIFIGCLGLFGLAAFTTEQRTKEIGVRKVLGANVAGIVVLLSKEFAKLVLIAFVLSVPIAYYYMNLWLQDFQYRVELGYFTFISAGLIALAIAMLTVSYHAVKIAVTCPSKSLRYE